jgi:hypothetical protein
VRIGKSFSVSRKVVAGTKSQFQKEQVAERVEDILSDSETDSVLQKAHRANK